MGTQRYPENSALRDRLVPRAAWCASRPAHPRPIPGPGRLPAQQVPHRPLAKALYGAPQAARQSRRSERPSPQVSRTPWTTIRKTSARYISVEHRRALSPRGHKRRGHKHSSALSRKARVRTSVRLGDHAELPVSGLEHPGQTVRTESTRPDATVATGRAQVRTCDASIAEQRLTLLISASRPGLSTIRCSGGAGQTELRTSSISRLAWCPESAEVRTVETSGLGNHDSTALSVAGQGLTTPAQRPSADSSAVRKRASSDECKSARKRPTDPQLKRIVQVWPRLPAAIKAAMLTLVRSITTDAGSDM